MDGTMINRKPISTASGYTEITSMTQQRRNIFCVLKRKTNIVTNRKTAYGIKQKKGKKYMIEK